MNGRTSGSLNVPNTSRGGFEWIQEAYERDIKPSADAALLLEAIRTALAEGKIKATLQSEVGELYRVKKRMWRKSPVRARVYPIFENGRLRQRLKLYAGPYVEGPVFVNARQWQKALDNYNLPRRRALAAGSRCYEWLVGLMKPGEGPTQRKRDYQDEAIRKFGVTDRAFVRAWKKAIEDTDAKSLWSKPGPKSNR